MLSIFLAYIKSLLYDLFIKININPICINCWKIQKRTKINKTSPGTNILTFVSFRKNILSFGKPQEKGLTKHGTEIEI